MQTAKDRSPGSAHRPDIDGLRAVSILGVLLFHLGAAWLPGGFVGVDVFFVISGFLITGIIAREIDAGDFSYARFYERRIRRIYPALIVTLVATTAVAHLVMVPTLYRAFGRTLVWTPLFASNFAFLGQAGYFDPDQTAKPLLHTWSLGVEEQFYIVFPLVLGAVRRFGGNRIAVVGGLLGLSLAGSVAAGVLGWADGYFLLPVRFWELGCGGLLALLPIARLGERTRSALGVVGLATIVGSMLAIDESMAFPGWVAVFPVFGAAAVIAAQAGPARHLLSTAAMTFVGRISYPMYLWHWPLIVFAQMYFFHPATPLEGAAVVVLTVVLSWATLVAVETPIRSRRLLAERRSLFVAAAVASVVLVAAGVAIFTFGKADRWTSDEQRRIAAVGEEVPRIDALCPATRGGIAGETPLCVVGASGPGAPPPSFAVIGDSHARAMAGAIDTAAARLGRSGLYFGRLGCPPLLGVDQFHHEEGRCAEHLAAALDLVRAGRIDTVIVIARWAEWIEGRDYGRMPAEVRTLVRGGRTIGEDERIEAVSAALEATLGKLDGRRVVLVGSVPEVRFSVPDSIANALRLGRPQPQGPTRAAFDARQAKTRAVLAALMERQPQIAVLEPSEVFCDAERCRIVEDGIPLYVDSDHLSQAGAARLEPLFERALGAASGITFLR